MKSKIIFILSLCLLLVSCNKPIERFSAKPIYEISVIKSSDLIEKDKGAFIGLITNGFSGMLVGEFIEDTVNNLDLNIKNKNVKVCLICVEPSDLEDSTLQFDADVSDLITLNWKIGDRLEFYKEMDFTRYKNKYGRTYTKTSIFNDACISGIQYYKKIIEE